MLKTGLERGLPTEVRLVHADPTQQFRVDPGTNGDLDAFLEWMKDAKASGVKIHTNDAILDYQLALVRHEHVDWTCTAGFKIYLVSAQGKFWICSMLQGDKDLMDVTADDLRANNTAKSCQDGCGVYCCVSTSMIYANPVRVIGREIGAKIRRLGAARTAGF